jgi:predicted ATPase
MADRLVAHLSSKQLLLVLDNFEHLAAATPLIGRLLAAPRISMLITSRARLRLRAEREFVVPPLPVPVPDLAEDVLGYASVALFVDRARAAGSSLNLSADTLLVVAEICRRLDGLPLAIELAASRAKALPPSALLERLNRRLAILADGSVDHPMRQRSMRGALDWTYDLLGPDERAAFATLSVCVGGCSLEAAQAIVGWDSDRLLDVVGVLVDHSLACVHEDTRHEPRVIMLETVREYGLERLAERSDEEALARARHAAFFLHAAEEASPHLVGSPRQSEWLQRLEADRGNLLVALTWAREGAEYQFGVRLVSAIGPFWYFRGYLSEGRYWIDLFLAATASDPDPPVSRLWLLYGACKLALEQGDYPRAREVALQAHVLAQRLDSALGMSQALELQGTIAHVSGDSLGSRLPLEQSVFWARRAAERPQLERSLFWLAQASRAAGDLVRAELAFEELLATSRDGPEHGTALVLLSLGQLARERQEDAHATVRYCDALDLFAQMRDPAGVAACCEGLAGVARRRGDLHRTVRLAAAASGLRASAASALSPPERQAIDEDVAAARLALGDAAVDKLWAEGATLTYDEVVAYASE